MKVAVLMGGNSDERDVSLASGVQVARALREAGHEVLALDTRGEELSRDEEERLVRDGVAPDPPPEDAWRADEDIVSLVADPGLSDVDVFFLALHGGSGEDGTIQAILDTMGVTYTGSDRLGCSLAMDKEVSKRLLRDAGVPTPEWIRDPTGPEAVVEGLGLPVIVKAAGGGSSLRLALAHDMDELRSVLDESRGWHDVVLAERYVKGRELTVGVLGEEALAVGEIVPAHEIFDYECKYQPGLAREIFPADISAGVAEELRALAARTHRAFRLRDYSRVDFIVDEEGGAWCLEANALPGMTANSLLPKSARAMDIPFPELCDRIVRQAAARMVVDPRR
jgi:D-alanine-D-alanine ligase